MQKERLNVKVTLSGTYWDRRPQYMILLGSENITGEITGASGVHETIEFDVSLDEDRTHTLYIYLLNKTDSDTVESADKSQILDDMLLNIEDISIDGIRLEQKLWTHSTYLTEKFAEPIRGCVNLGWNGVWAIEFRSPFYIWFLENS